MEGQSFCPAAIEAVEILGNNVLSIGAINLVGDSVLFLAKVAVTSATAVAALLVLQADAALHFYAVPLLLTVAAAFFIAHCFFSVYEVGSHC